MPGALVRMSSPTRMPRLTSSPAARARSIFGRMPIASTTRSAGISRPSASTTPSARSVAEDFLGLAVGEKRDAARVEVAAQQFAGRRCRAAVPSGSASDGRPRPTCRAASDPRPLRAPTARRRSRPRGGAVSREGPAIIASTSAISRKARTPGSPRPGIGGASGFEPVASSSLSYPTASPLASVTVFAAGSIAVAGSPAISRMLRSSYQPSGLMTMSATLLSPASTEDSRMRL